MMKELWAEHDKGKICNQCHRVYEEHLTKDGKWRFKHIFMAEEK